MDSIDKLLAELKAEYDESATPQQQPSKPNVAQTFIQPSPKSSSLIDKILADVKLNFDEKDAAEELKKQQELEQIKAQQLEVLQKQAKDWLGKLDPFSSEGLWFERFAEGYSSKLEAAIEYLQTNQ